MKSNVFTILLLLTIISSYSICQCSSVEILALPSEDGVCNNGFYVLVFKDEFEGSSLDPNKWVIVEGVPRDPQHNHEWQWYDPANVSLSGGILSLTATKESSPFTKTFSIWEDNGPVEYTQDFTYKSGSIQSKYHFTDGMLEIRCKVPKGVGFFPAFWLYGGGPLNEYGDYDFSEIDIFEMWNPSNLSHLGKELYFNIHFYDPGDSGNQGACPGEFYDGTDFSSEFHTYTCIWDQYKVEWYVDGDLKYIATRWHTILGQQLDCSSLSAFSEFILHKEFPDDPMQIIANFALSSASGSGAPDASTIFPSSYEIDYIKYWKKVPCEDIVNVETFDDQTLDDGIYHVIVGNTINVSASSVLESGEQLTLIGQHINIESGFTAQPGSDFETLIEANLCGKSTSDYATSDDLIYDWSIHKVPVENSEKPFKIFPNPTNSKVNVEINANLQYLQIALLSPLGQTLFIANSFENSIVELDLTSFEEGVYTVLIFDRETNYLYTDRIIKL